MKRFVSFAAVILSAVLISALIPASFAARSVTSVTVDPLVITEYTDGVYVQDGGYFVYDVTPGAMTVTYSDGSSEELGYIDILLSGYEFSTDQTASSPWGIGTHQAFVSAGGGTFSYDVVIAGTEVASLSAERVSVREYTGGEWVRTGDGATDEFYRYRIAPGNVSVTFKDGSEDTLKYKDIEYGKCFFIDPQSADGKWDVGVHTVTLYCFGSPCTLEVEVTESPLESVTFDPVSMRADERLSEVSWSGGGQSGKYPVYDVTPSGIIIKYKNGDTQTGTKYYLQYLTGETMYFRDDQSRTNVWSVGVHTVRLTFMGKVVYYDVEITPPKEPGDSDGDGEVTMKDILLMRRTIAGLDDLTTVQLKRSDIDFDSDVTMKDVLKARRIIAGLG